MSRLVIGITGPIGSGVSTMASAFHEKSFKHVKISDEIKKEVSAELGQVLSREKLQDIGNQRRAGDPAYWVKKSLLEAAVVDQDFNVVDKTSDVVIESIRNLHEARSLMDLFAPNFFLLAVQASRDTRWNRMKSPYSGREYDFNKDDERDTDEDIDHGQQVDRCVQFADYVYVNESPKGARDTQSKLIWGEIEDDVKLMRSAHDYLTQSNCRAASPQEVSMAVAYAQSHQSQCMKRLVGAVIVDDLGIPLSVGFNENPGEMSPCKTHYGYCFKDSDMHDTLEKQTDVFCPSCGKKLAKIEKPYRCTDCGENLKLRFFPSRNMEVCTAIHAEERAIRSLGGRSAKGATLYCTTFPCFQCARYIVDAGIKHVVYVEAYPVKQSATFLTDNSVTFAPFHGFKARSFNLVFKQVR